MPDNLSEWVMDISERIEAPPDYVAVSAIAGLATLIGRKVGIRPKKYDDWLVVPNVWGALVGGPSMRKSPCLQEATKPLRRIAAKYREAHADAITDHEVSKTVYETRVSAAKQDLKKGNGSEGKLREAMCCEPERPTEKRLITSDATIEKLGILLNRNTDGMLLLRDEMAGWLRSFEKAGHESDRAFYLEAWNGTGGHNVDRVGRDDLYVEALILSVMGTIQPGPLAEYIHLARKGGSGDDGFVQRIQMAVYPDFTGPFVGIDRIPNKTARDAAYAVFDRLAELKSGDIGDPGYGNDPNYLRFSDDAQNLFDDWYVELLNRAVKEEGPMEAHLMKYCSLVPSLALIFNLAELHPLRGNEPVTHAALRMAVHWAGYLESHARRIYASETDRGMVGAKGLLKHILAGDLSDVFKPRDVQRKQWQFLTTKEDVTASLDVLEDFGWVRCRQEKTGGRPSNYVEVHPRKNGFTP
jgi:hypothetical protein